MAERPEGGQPVSASYSPTGYWAVFKQYRRDDRPFTNGPLFRTFVFPIVDVVDDEARVIDNTGRAVTVRAHRGALGSAAIGCDVEVLPYNPEEVKE